MLRLLGNLYGRVADLRNALYDRGLFESHSLGALTISIGNITSGGTGKTPLVIYVAEILAQKGEKVCVLTRGYGRSNPKRRILVSNKNKIFVDAKTGGDEPVEIASKLFGKAFVIADADRVSAAAWAKEQFGITAFVLDDAFQHRRAKRDLDIVCVDATNPFGNGWMLPAGILREPIANLRRANLIIITRTNLVNDISNLKYEISHLAPESSIIEASSKISTLMEIKDFHSRSQGTQRINENSEENIPTEFTEYADEIQNQKSKIKNRPALAFCALGNPSNFFNQLSAESFELTAKKPFPDHHYYSQKDVNNIERLAQSAGAEIILTTAKDAVKLTNFQFQIPCFVVDTELKISDTYGFLKLIGAF